VIVFIIIWSVWFLSEILLNRLMRSGNNKTDHDKGTLRLIWITIGLANSAGILSAIFLYQLQIGGNIIINYSGLVVIILGIILRFVSVYSLGKFFTVDVTIRHDHRLMKDGIYKYLRHPSYSGSVLSFIGFGLSLNNWGSLIVISIPVLFAMISRIKTEEQVLSAEFGDEYTEYMKRTWRLLPLIY
jgi:protein-S-isoprenylcysteine O-methyltransferase Ste14